MESIFIKLIDFQKKVLFDLLLMDLASMVYSELDS